MSRLFPRGINSFGPSRLQQQLAGDAARPRPPVSLPGRLAPPPPPLPPATEPPPRQNGQAAGHNGRIHKRESSEPQPEDAIGAHTAEEYRRMNDRFVVAVQEAFRAGKESPAAACRVGGPSPAK